MPAAGATQALRLVANVTSYFKKSYMKENWLFIKTPDHYGKPEIIQFDENVIDYFNVEKKDGISLITIINENRNEKLSETEYKFINQNRIRFFRNGKIYKVFSDEKSITEDCIFENDYEKLNATETELTESEIQNLKFEFNWNGEKMNLRFNEVLDSPVIQEINKRLNKEGSRIVLEKLNQTLFVSLYTDNYLDKLIPIKYVDRQKIILYGFPKEPYEINCPIVE
jgi:polynucleotide 5'-kinase involved in rRNA processing